MQKYNLIRARLIEGNLGLVYDLIGRTRFNNLERDEMSSEGMMALLRAQPLNLTIHRSGAEIWLLPACLME